MQANAGNRFRNMQIFLKLLECIGEICNERLIGHIAFLDIKHPSQNWYRDFFRLAGFVPCRCQSSASIAQQFGTWSCLVSRNTLAEKFLAVYERTEDWFAEGRCTKTLIDSVASGEASEVERRYFKDLLAELGIEEHPQSAATIIHTEAIVEDTSWSASQSCQSALEMSPVKKRALQPVSKVVPSIKHPSAQHPVLQNGSGSPYQVSRKHKRNQKTQTGGCWRTRKGKNQ